MHGLDHTTVTSYTTTIPYYHPVFVYDGSFSSILFSAFCTIALSILCCCFPLLGKTRVRHTTRKREGEGG